MLWCLLGVALASVEELHVGKRYILQPSRLTTTYHINTNYQRTEILVECLDDIDYVQWSDSIGPNFECGAESALCGSKS
jgi:hypothetical protein